jgi:hypothetical protein
MNTDQLKARKAELERQRDEFARNAQAQIERMTGAIAILEELIAQADTAAADA